MEDRQLSVRMLGGFSITLNGKSIDDSENRSKKVWLLLAYMIYYRNRAIMQEELTDLLWGHEESSANPANALKTMFHRVRSMLDQLGEGMGHTLIVRRRGGYAWNNDIPMFFDVDEFEAHYKCAQQLQGTQQLAEYAKCIELYQSDFLSKLSNEVWVLPIAIDLRKMHTDAVEQSLQLLEQMGQQEQAIELAGRAIKIEPYDENLYRHLMRNLIEIKDQRGAVAVYEEMSALFFDNFGVMPAEDIRSMYREAVRVINDRAISPGVVREQLRETAAAPGALFCDYDFFKVLYQAEARGIVRRGEAIHIGLLTMQGEGGKELSKRSLKRAMENLKEQVCLNLRRGDVAAQCSVSQYILMLQKANYENSCMVCERIVKAFKRQFPHSPAQLECSVQPMEPSEN